MEVEAAEPLLVAAMARSVIRKTVQALVAVMVVWLNGTPVDAVDRSYAMRKQIAVSFFAQESEFKAVDNVTKKVNEWLAKNPGWTVANLTLSVSHPPSSPMYAYLVAVFETGG